MAKQLNIDEMLQLCTDLGLPDASEYVSAIEEVGSRMAAAIANRLNVEAGDATFEGLGFAGTCAPFYARHKGQRCPVALREYDSSEWTDREGRRARNA